MSERQKSLVAVWLVILAGVAGILADLSQDATRGIARLETHIATQRVRKELVPAEDLAAVSKALSEMRAMLNDAWEFDRRIDGAQIRLIVAIGAGGAAFLAGPGGAVFLSTISVAVGLRAMHEGIDAVWGAAWLAEAALRAIGGSLALLPAIITGAVS